MKRFLSALLLSSAVFGVSAAHAAVYINEVMYRPYNESTVGKYEFVELYNDGNAAVDLSGLILTDSSDYANICAGVGAADNEGVYQIPSGTSIPAHGYYTFWHTAITGVTDKPYNQVYSSFLFFGNLVLNNDGDQVTLLNCSGGVNIVDSVDYGALNLDGGNKNISIERYSDQCGGSPAWRFSSASNGGGPALGGGYTKGGTPGAAASIPGLTTRALSQSFQNQVAQANTVYDGYSLEVDAFDITWNQSQPPTLYQAVQAVNGIQNYQYWPWEPDQCMTLAQVEAELDPAFEHLVAPLVSELGNGTETVGAYVQRAEYYAAPGASAWRAGITLIFPVSRRVAFLQKEIGEI